MLGSVIARAGNGRSNATAVPARAFGAEAYPSPDARVELGIVPCDGERTNGASTRWHDAYGSPDVWGNLADTFPRSDGRRGHAGRSLPE